jgi:hypothetical protein
LRRSFRVSIVHCDEAMWVNDIANRCRHWCENPVE